MSQAPVLQVENLKTHFFTSRGVVKSVDGVSFSLGRGEVLGLVGESGAGKSVLGFSILGLIDPPGRIIDGRILFGGRDLCQMKEKQLREIRGGRIAMVFQDPLTCLDPVFSIGYQMAETIHAHRHAPSRSAIRKCAADLLTQVQIASPAQRLEDYPHQFSGGMRQRVGIAMAISNAPELIIADEPTTALDVTTQAQIMGLLYGLVQEKKSALLLITHDIALVGQICDTIGVMYAGHLVELGPKKEVITRPLHPYTQGLINAIPGQKACKGEITQIPGMMPDLSRLPRGCPFEPRCELSIPACRKKPALLEAGPGHFKACHLAVDKHP